MEINIRNVTFDELEKLCHQANDPLALELLRRYYRIIKAHDDAVREAVDVMFDTAEQQGALL